MYSLWLFMIIYQIYVEKCLKYYNNNKIIYMRQLTGLNYDWGT